MSTPATTTPAAPSAAQQNALVAIMFFAAGIVFLDRFGIAYLFPQIGAELGLDASQLAGLVSVTAIAWAVSSLVFSFLSDRLGGRNKLIIVISLVAFSVLVGLIGLSPNYGIMLLFRALIGFAAGPALPLIQGIVARNSSETRRGRNMGFVIAGTAIIGSALAPSIMVGLASVLGWRGAFPLITVPGLIVALLVGLLVKEPKGVASDIHQIRWSDFGLIFRSRNIWLTLVGSIVCMAVAIGFGGFAPSFLAAQGMDQGTSTLVLTVYGITGALGAVITPWLSDRFGRKPVLFVSAICMGLLPIFFILFSHNPVALGISLVVNLLGAGLVLVTYVIPGESVPKTVVATAYALQIAIGETIGGALGPTIGGAIADGTGDLTNALWFYAGIVVILLVMTLFIEETAPRVLARRAAATDAAVPTTAPATSTAH